MAKLQEEMEKQVVKIENHNMSMDASKLLDESDLSVIKKLEDGLKTVK